METVQSLFKALIERAGDDSYIIERHMKTLLEIQGSSRLYLPKEEIMPRIRPLWDALFGEKLPVNREYVVVDHSYYDGWGRDHCTMVYSAAQLMEMKPIRPWELLWEHCIEVYPEIEDEEEEEDFPDCKGLSDAQVVVALSCISRLPKPISWGKELVPGVFGCRMSHCCSERDTCRQLLLDCAAAQQGLPVDTEFFPTEYAEEFLPKSCDFDEEDEEYPDWEPRQGSGYELERRFLLENCLYLYKHLMALRQELLEEAGDGSEG